MIENKALSLLQNGGSCIFLLLVFCLEEMMGWIKIWIHVYKLTSFHDGGMTHSCEQMERV